jgi:hypothetical protein
MGVFTRKMLMVINYHYWEAILIKWLFFMFPLMERNIRCQKSKLKNWRY